MRTDTKRNLLFAAMTFGVLLIPLLLVAEWAARVRYRATLYQESEESEFVSTYQKSSDPELVYEMIPNSESPGKKPGALSVINADGFRDDPFNPWEDRESYRIVLLGDSVAWGYGVDTEDAFPQLLERLINEDIPDASPQVEIFNLAVMGYSTAQQARLLELRGKTYNPDLVMVAYVLNDPDEVDGGLSRYFDPPSFYLKDSFIRFRRWWAAERIGRTRGGGYPEVVHTLYWDDVKKNLDRFQDISEEEGVPILFVQVPAFTWEGDRYPELKLEKRLSGEFEKRGFMVHPLWPAFRGTDAESLRYDYWHPNEEGHQMIAEDLLRFFRGTGLIPRPPMVKQEMN